jgi:hypothetical protein
MAKVILVGPEIEENLSLRYIASSLFAAGHSTEILPFNGDHHFLPALDAIIDAPEPPALVGISLAFQWRARDFLALAVALRERGYRGHITLGGHFATFESAPILGDFPEVDSICRQEVGNGENASVSVSVKGVCNHGPSTLSVGIGWMGPAKTASPTANVQEY